MKTKKEPITRYTRDALRAIRAESGSGSDWARAGETPLPDGRDPDDAMEPVRMDWVSTELPKLRRKSHASLRIDADVLDWFRAQGRGYQTRINAILRHYYEQRTRST